MPVTSHVGTLFISEAHVTIALDSKKRTTVLNVLESRGIIRRGGHFEYMSGEHGTDAVDTDAIYRDPRLLAYIARQLAMLFTHMRVEVVAGLTGKDARSVQLAVLAALELPRTKVVELHKNERHHTCSFRARDMEFIKGKRVLLLDDIVRSGETVMGAASALKRHHANVVGIGVICDQSVTDATACDAMPLWFWAATRFTDCTFRSLITLGSKRWSPTRCKKDGPCKHRVPLVNVKDLPSIFLPTGK